LQYLKEIAIWTQATERLRGTYTGTLSSRNDYTDASGTREFRAQTKKDRKGNNKPTALCIDAVSKAEKKVERK
jgi:hypothetical protein